MFLYHGSPAQFDKPSLEKCKPHRDFGRGFYLAENYFDALPMAIKNSYEGYVYTYELDDTSDLIVLELNGYSNQWLETVVKARLGDPPKVDLIIGNMAAGGSNLQSKFAKLRSCRMSVRDACTIMRKELTETALGVQYAFTTATAISKLRLIEVEEVEKNV